MFGDMKERGDKQYKLKKKKQFLSSKIKNN